MEHDAVKEALVDVAVGVDKGHALEEGMDAETDEQSGVFAAGAVVVAVLHASSDLLKE